MKWDIILGGAAALLVLLIVSSCLRADQIQCYPPSYCVTTSNDVPVITWQLPPEPRRIEPYVPPPQTDAERRGPRIEFPPGK